MRRPFGSHVLVRLLRGAGGLLLLALLVAAALVRPPVPFDGGLRAAHAQWWGDDRNPWGAGRPSRRPSYPQQQRGGFFGIPFFGGWGGPDYRESPEDGRPRRERAPVDFSRAPPPKKLENPPAKSVLVLGDAMADWLGSGLEDAFAEDNEYGVVRKPRANSGLIHNEPREYDWVQAARDALSNEKPDFVVMMLGLSDRRAFRERAPSRTPPPAVKSGQTNDPPSVTEPERHGGITSYEFRSDKWSELYAKRVDEVIAVLKSKRVPVLWVGLPPVRGPKARADVAFLNDIYKAEAEKNGIVYVDVWDGFVDDAGEFSYHGPDVLGQVRRLRSGDGVYFTKAGARKLAHYVDREMRRLLNRETTPVALPIPSDAVQPALPVQPSGPAPRPAAGPVIPLTGGRPEAEALLGGRGDAPRLDPDAVKVLVKGEAPAPAAGRADNFAWPPPQTRSENDILAPPVVAVPRAARPAASAPDRPGRQRAASAAAPTPAKHVRPTTARRPGPQVESTPARATR
jgi:hypothetical protein